MNASKFNPIEWISEVGRKAHILLVMKTMECAEDPAQRRLMQLSAGVTMLTLCVGTAHADGIADMIGKAADQGDSIKTYAGRLFGAGGFLLAGYGGYNWWRKGKEGEQSHVKAGQIAWPILGGAALGATGFVLVKAGETIGISGASQGALPN
jgi:hypothetical protein